jgi:DNA-binding NarL/FixJ family response regulator
MKDIEQKIKQLKKEKKDIRHNKLLYQGKECYELEKKGLTFREIGKKLGMSHENVRQSSIKYQAGFYH